MRGKSGSLSTTTALLYELKDDRCTSFANTILRHRMVNHTRDVRWSSSDSALPHPTVRRYGRVRSALCAAARPGEKVRFKGTSKQTIHRGTCYVA